MSDVESTATGPLEQETTESAEDLVDEQPETSAAEAEASDKVDITEKEEKKLEEEQPEAVAETDQSELKALKAELGEVQAQAAEYLDGWQRARAEFTNYKKRVEAERENLRRTGNEALLLKLLPVVDDFQRAAQRLPEDLADVPWVEGMAMILRKLQAVLESENVTCMEAVGQPFDPQWHQAVMQEETTEHPDGIVIEELQQGYRLGERVLRPSMVKVASNQQKVSNDTE